MYYLCSENKGADQLRSYRTAKLTCVFVFAYADCWFSHEVAQIVLIKIGKLEILNFDKCSHKI